MSQYTAEDVVDLAMRHLGLRPAEIARQVEDAMAATTDSGKTVKELDPELYAHFSDVVQVAKRLHEAADEEGES